MGRTSAVNISLEEVRLIGERDRRIVTHTPVAPSAHLSERYGGSVLLKAENLQRTGAFKIRGAMNKLATLGEAARRGVVAGSAGNHAGALAFAAREFGVPCEIYVPAGASLSKIAACRGYGATVHEGGESLDVAVALAQARANETGMVFCHPYDDPVVVAGQATLGVELIDDIPDLAQVIVPLGGGGLLSGVALTVKQFDPSIKVVGVQISSCAPYIYGKAPLGPVPTLADGIAVKVPGDVTAPLIEKWVDEIVDVDEDSVADAMMLLLERSKLFVEGGGAVGVSALIAGRIKPAERGTTCVVLSGGNADLGLLTGLVRRHETNSGRRLILFARISDRPGGLARLLTVFAQYGANLIEVEHVREGVDLHVRETGVQVVLEVRGRDHTETLIAAAKAEGYEISEVTGR
jgi:threonine dehydratase